MEPGAKEKTGPPLKLATEKIKWAVPKLRLCFGLPLCVHTCAQPYIYEHMHIHKEHLSQPPWD